MDGPQHIILQSASGVTCVVQSLQRLRLRIRYGADQLHFRHRYLGTDSYPQSDVVSMTH